MDPTLCPGAARPVPGLCVACGRPARAVSAAAAYSRPMVAALSPSRASDFMPCPMLYRFRVIDKLPVAADARRRPGARSCTPSSSGSSTCPRPSAPSRPPWALVPQEWERLADEEPAMLDLLAEHDGQHRRVVRRRRDAAARRWFGLEDPTRLEPAERELYVETEVDGLVLRGYVDRLDVAPERRDARRRLQDRAARPREHFEAKALFQMKFYALVLWRLRGVDPQRAPARLPRQRRDRRATSPTSRTCSAPSARSRRCGRRSSAPRRPATGARARAGCATGATTGPLCPAWGGTPPPLPDDAAAARRRPRLSRASSRSTTDRHPPPERRMPPGRPTPAYVPRRTRRVLRP